MIDLMSIARTEADGGDLFSVFDGMFEASDVKPDGSPDAVVWKGAITTAPLTLSRIR